MKVPFAEGISTPPTMPTVPDCVRAPAAIPARYVASLRWKSSGTTLAAGRDPDEITKVTSGYCAATRLAASWYSKPCPKIRPYPASA